ncbi:hypothetical protein MHAE_03345 [Mycobacterium haemophilum DSM 44634]|uniref:TauD/TfdA family dioxygenase n=1 Tax=Mycobacterium haemophilum TaxID=29311 RepID=UPI00065567CC|nr:TauD/TfdA family dioxygenase [Mycobacterium haemophilum]AKN17634.1 hypothetical protein B586_15310 [Mycobacterium haemophilum DSM 44634]MCV7341803.1 TauD/TfdA family dioxygenase [Mycobacterium haemophilum DSM 44634]
MSWPARVAFAAAEHEALRAAAAPWTVSAMDDLGVQRGVVRDACRRLPTLRQTLHTLEAAVRQTGAVIATGTPLDDQVLIAVASLFGRVTADGNGPPPGQLVYNLVTGPESGYDPAALQLHTDSVFEASPAPYMGLACVRPSAEGDGLTTLARADSVAARVGEIDQRHLELLQDRCYPFAKIRNRVPQQFPVRTAILTVQDTDVTTVFHGRHVREGMQLRPEAVDSEHRAALHTFEAVLDDPCSATTLLLQTGDLLLADNRRVLHGRSAVRSTGSRRHVKRLKIAD